MRIAIGGDHAGFEMKRDLAGYLIRIMPQKVALWLVGIVVSSQAVISIYGLFSA